MDLFKNVGYLLKDVSRRYVARFERHAAEVSLTLMLARVARAGSVKSAFGFSTIQLSNSRRRCDALACAANVALNCD